jgi:hypothetical protein
VHHEQRHLARRVQAQPSPQDRPAETADRQREAVDGGVQAGGELDDGRRRVSDG